MENGGDVTQLLDAFKAGDQEAFERLVPIVYQDLRRIAHAHLRQSRSGQTLNTTGLVHEAYLRLVDQTGAEWQNRQHFLSVCACAMRQIVISNARKKHALKRGGEARNLTLEEDRIVKDDQSEWFIALDDALTRLGKEHPRLARVVECRYFAGFTEEETALALQTSLRTVQRDWMKARAWLRSALGVKL